MQDHMKTLFFSLSDKFTSHTNCENDIVCVHTNKEKA